MIPTAQSFTLPAPPTATPLLNLPLAAPHGSARQNTPPPKLKNSLIAIQQTAALTTFNIRGVRLLMLAFCSSPWEDHDRREHSFPFGKLKSFPCRYRVTRFQGFNIYAVT